MLSVFKLAKDIKLPDIYFFQNGSVRVTLFFDVVIIAFVLSITRITCIRLNISEYKK